MDYGWTLEWEAVGERVLIGIASYIVVQLIKSQPCRTYIYYNTTIHFIVLLKLVYRSDIWSTNEVCINSALVYDVSWDPRSSRNVYPRLR